ncbi:response regulator transcription factor [Hoyosella rhizosphaerae]|uniref:DNA-binding response regulator n=1 Tax=Hoyosella rhizosphaerae TaxID=1755582 RepID=A0A916XDD4_9ACTN|nr:response regulator [Hoyosella rhizosphaerae]MBN4926091.1 response regulator transcription factor [Hoyosella rhizosphaerae]GGC65658.1 DNA-binding response regulator [Hoyosella rhizosphaerae]
MVRVAFIDDDRMLLDGIGSWLARDGNLILEGTAHTVNEFLGKNPHDVDVVVLDLFLSDESDPADNVAKLVEAGFPVLVVSVTPQAVHGIDVVAAGASGYLTKDNDLGTLSNAISVVARGEMAYSPELAFAWTRDTRPSKPKLSAQERAVLLDYATGLTLEAAARRAGVKVSTAKSYLDRVKAKYAQVGRPAATKLELASRVREDGLQRESKGSSD